jgi:hypothetical protein
MMLFTQLQVDTSVWVSFLYMTVIGVGLGLGMQSLVLAVQNAVDMRDMGAGTAAITFFRSLGGSFGVAILGAVLSARLTSELASRLPAAIRQLPPAQASRYASGGGSSISINEPAKILALPAPIRDAIQHAFVASLHTVFLVTGLVAIAAVAVTLALPDRELRGAGPATAPGTAPEAGTNGSGPSQQRKPSLEEEPAETAAAEMEAKTAGLI